MVDQYDEEMAAVFRDAARYRWLREHFDSIAVADLGGGWDVAIGALEETGDAGRAAELDVRIDGSMAAPGVGGTQKC